MSDLEKRPSVSIICTAYNHEKYIRKCLDGIVVQQTDFPFEVIVHDDASTDNTADIIREYEIKYPNIIKPIYQKENQHSKGIKIYDNFILPLVNGKYVAFCEGDDFWIDPLKLQKQYDALERHPECKLCVGRAFAVQEDGVYPTQQFYPSKKLPFKSHNSCIISSRSFLEKCMSYYLFHTSTYFCTSLDYKNFFKAKFRKAATVGDEPLLLYFGQLAKVYYLSDIVSCRRKNAIGSWTERIRLKAEPGSLYENKIRLLKEFDLDTNLAHHDLVESTISGFKIRIAAGNRNYKECITENNRPYLKLAFPNLKSRLKIYIGAYFPLLIGKYDALKEAMGGVKRQ